MKHPKSINNHVIKTDNAMVELCIIFCRDIVDMKWKGFKWITMHSLIASHKHIYLSSTHIICMYVEI